MKIKRKMMKILQKMMRRKKIKRNQIIKTDNFKIKAQI